MLRFSKQASSELRALSMYYPCPIFYKGKVFHSPMHLLSWLKCKDQTYREYVEHAYDPMQAAFFGSPIGRSFTSRRLIGPNLLRKDWSDVAVKLVTMVIRLKLRYNPVIGGVLARTKKEELVEQDIPLYWDLPKPENRTAKILMNFRKEAGHQ